MILAQEELRQAPGHPGMIVVTTNGTISKKGALVMGRGAAKEACNRIRGIEYECGKFARSFVPLGSSTGYSQYGFTLI